MCIYVSYACVLSNLHHVCCHWERVLGNALFVVYIDQWQVILIFTCVTFVFSLQGKLNPSSSVSLLETLPPENERLREGLVDKKSKWIFIILRLQVT